ncbi:MAG: ROK family protein [Hyphomicrobiales bacterium]|nr:ROK family protein [Hyphomicrobiales bacterium]
MSPAFRIGIDLGGTKITGLGLDAAGETVARHRIAAPRHDYDATVEAVAGLVDRIEQAAGRSGSVGVGIPGSVSPASGRVQNANSTWLNGRRFDADLTARLGRPVRLANDANCFALSEAIDGAGAGAGSVFGVILGTGCGGGFVLDRKVLVGCRAIGGEWGHNPLPWPEPDELPGPDCWCGRSGCLETWISGPGLAADHARVTGDDLPAEDIARLAQRGDGAARASLDRHVSRAARGLASVVNILDPEVIVLGGGLSQMPHLYDELPKRIAAHVFADRTEIAVKPPAHGDDGGVRGAAWLWGGPGRA